MDWLTEIFSEKQQQAQLVSMLFSVTVAVVVLFLNQWFLSRRARREILIKKIEELYISIEEYKRNSELYMMRCFSVHTVIDEDVLDDLYDNVCTSINKIIMFFDLYFTDSKIDLTKLYDLVQSVYIDFHIERWSWGEITEDRILILDEQRVKYSGELSKQIDEMNNYLICKMKKNKH